MAIPTTNSSVNLFPTVITETEPPTSGTNDRDQELVRSYLLASIGRLERLARTQHGNSSVWRQALNQSHGLLQLLEGKEASPDASQFSALLREKREAAGLTQKELAERCGLSTELIRYIEKGKRSATVATMRRLAAVPQLRLEASHLLPFGTAVRAESLNGWAAPNLDAVAMLQELQLRLAAPGGRIEQTYMYLDHQSALDWWKIANAPQYLSGYRHPMPLEDVAARAMECVGQAPLDVLALGPGDGMQETRLVHALISHQLERDLRFYLLDISQPLLSKAHRHARDCLDTLRGVMVISMFGNFHYLPLYEQIFYSPAKRRRIFTMLGATLNNLDDEPGFFRNSLRCASKDDLLLLDFTVACAPAAQPAQIQALDPALNQPMPEPIEAWLSGPFRRNGYVREVAGAYRLNGDCPVPGSYSLDAQLRVIDDTGSAREFVVWRVKRYEPEPLLAWLRGMGWEQVHYARFGHHSRNQTALLLLRKRD